MDSRMQFIPAPQSTTQNVQPGKPLILRPSTGIGVGQQLIQYRSACFLHNCFGRKTMKVFLKEWKVSGPRGQTYIGVIFVP